MADFYCRQDFKDCPYRYLRLDKDLPLCNYFRLHSQLMINREFSRIPDLYNKACDWIRDDELRRKSLLKISRERVLDFLERIQVGDVIFCRKPPFHKVRLIKKPLNEAGYAICETPNGKTMSIDVYDLNYVSKGNYSGEYLIEGIKNKKKARELEFKAQYYGLRTKLQDQENGFLLTIFGDSQENVDDFINLVLKNGLELLPLLAGPQGRIH